MRHAHSRAREAVLKALYQADVLKHVPNESSIEEILDSEGLSPRARQYATRLLKGCLEKQEELDRIISQSLRKWELSRLAAVDRCLLRLGAFELLYQPTVPPKVAINEAINLAKKYSTEQSGAFINGILDRIRKDYGQTKDPRNERGERPEPI